MNEKSGLISNTLKSGFLRSVITRVLAIFIIVGVVIAVVMFYTFTTEIRKSILEDRWKQLTAIEKTISNRMDEIISIAYNIGSDPVFYLSPVDDGPDSAREMSNTLKRYLVGNSFIEHLAYCRTIEPDKIYVSSGVRSLSDFFIKSFGMDNDTAASLIRHIHMQTETTVTIYGEGDNAYVAYLYPLPQLSVKPQAHVLMLIPIREVLPLLEAIHSNENDITALFDADGSLIYSTVSADQTLDLTDFVESNTSEQTYKSPAGETYVLQKVVSETNRWTFVSAIQYSNTLSGFANRQFAFIAFILLVLVIAIFIVLSSIAVQYKPIRKLAEQVGGNTDGKPMDERTLLSDTIASLKDDSEQKEKYEAAFYEAEAASKAKSAFLSSMSHDIRTPMNAIIGMTAIARKHIDDPIYIDDCLKKVQVSSDYLLDIINNVLDMSRIESGRIPITMEPVMIPALVDSVVSLITSSVEAKAQTLKVEFGDLTQPVIFGDSIHIIQVFVNILSNAVKFTPECGKITWSIRQAQSDDPQTGCYVFTFSDTGIGIPSAFIDHVFETFSRANESGTTRTEGTGLGMAIAKKLVELMGGTITCESELACGTTFTVTLHARYADECDAILTPLEAGKPHTSADDNIADLTGKRILLTEDNAMNREIAKTIISETGAEIFEAENGKIAVDAFASHPEGYFDLIFMDIQMPVMNGYEATAAIRSLQRADACTIPIYAMTANAFDEDIRQVKDAGMNGHIGKPYHPQTLLHVLSRILGKQ